MTTPAEFVVGMIGMYGGFWLLFRLLTVYERHFGTLPEAIISMLCFPIVFAFLVGGGLIALLFYDALFSNHPVLFYLLGF